MSKFVLAAAAALLLAGPALAQTEAADSAPTAKVSTSGVDFNDQAQAKAFYAKLWRTAYSVCDSNSANPRIAQADLGCVHRVMSQAVQQVNAPRLTAMLDRSMGGEANVYQAGAR